MKTWHLVAFLFLGGLLFPTSAPAQTLNGEVITTTYLYPDKATIYSLGTPINTTVPGGLTDFAMFVNIDFSSYNILITADRNAFINSVPFDGLEFYDPNAIFNSVTLDGSTTYAGFTGSRITFNSNQIFVNVADLSGLDGQTISLDINSPSSTPEPPTLLLFGTGLLTLLSLKRKP
jgi:PEP-CTERM motif